MIRKTPFSFPYMTKKPLPALMKRQPLFRNFLAASSISLLGTSIFDVAIPIYVADKTHSIYALSAATIALHLPFFIMAPITGYSVDNFNKRRVMLYSDLGQVLCLILFLIYDWVGAHALWPLLLTVFVAKTLMITFETVATFQLIPALVEPSDLSEANTWFLSAQRLIQIVGPLLAGVLMGCVGIRSCILANIVSFAATLLFVLKMKNLNELISGEEHDNWRKITLGDIASSFTDSINYIRNSSLFRPFVVMMVVWNLSSLNPNYPSVTYYFNVEKNFNPQQYGFVMSLFGVLGILGFLISGSIYRRFNFTKSFIGGGVWLALLASLSLGFMNHPMALALGLAFSKVGSSILSMGTFYLRQTNIPRAKMGGVNACLRMFFMSSTPLSCLVQPYLVDHLGTFWSFVVGALCLWVVVYYAAKVALAYGKTQEGNQKLAA